MEKYMKNGWWIAGAGVVTAVLIIIGCVFVLASDRTAPEITIKDMDITYRKGEKYGALLQGVTATDKKDGDVTSSVIVESVVVLKNKTQAKVCYVAKDKNNNLSRAYRTVNYVTEGVSSDVTDANLGNNTQGNGADEKETAAGAGNVKETQGQTQKETDKNSNSAATEPQSAVANGENPVLVLKTNEATLKKGERFNVVSYVADLADNKDSRDFLFTRIIADGKCDTGKAGDYTMTVYCSDSDMNYSEKKKLVVHVVE